MMQASSRLVQDTARLRYILEVEIGLPTTVGDFLIDKTSPVLHPVDMSAYIRPVRYCPISTATNLGELDDAIRHTCGLPNERPQPDAILIVSDSGSGYQMESPLVMHALGRLFRLPPLLKGLLFEQVFEKCLSVFKKIRARIGFLCFRDFVLFPCDSLTFF